MKKVYVFIIVLLCTAALVAQENRLLKVNNDTKLIEAVYYHENGEVQQKGTYTIEGKLHGNWYSYDVNGKKIAAAKYENGSKVGKWFFWTDDVLKEVDYNTNAIVSVVEWSNDKVLVAKN